jgi:hypothetical protein
MTEVTKDGREVWFGKTKGWIGFGPTTRQGRIVTVLYVLLLVVAVFTYSQLFLTVFVVLFYSLAFGFLVIAKSNLMNDRE